jgi:hypothetical protein
MSIKMMYYKTKKSIIRLNQGVHPWGLDKIEAVVEVDRKELG